MHHNIINDMQQIEAFLDLLPVLAPNERYLLTLLSRAKYVGAVPDHVCKKDATVRQVLCHKDQIVDELRCMEVPVGAYKFKGKEIVQDGLAAYIYLEPRDLHRGVWNTMDGLIDRMKARDSGNKAMTINPVSLALSAVAKSRGSRHFVDFDFDGDETSTADILQHINPEALTVIRTRGGFHALVKTDSIAPEFKKTWHPSISKLRGADMIGDMMLPIPGTVQGGFVPYLEY